MDGRCKRLAGIDDIISCLPTDLIHCILEYVPVPEAARTSILSRQWRHIWATHSQLVLDKQFTEETFKNKLCTEFVKTIDRILLFHGGPILKFTLYIPDFVFAPGEDIDTWVLFLSRNRIRDLTVDNAGPNNLCELSSSIFSCPELTCLKLCNIVIKTPHAFRCSRNLVTLHLERIAFEVNILEALFSTAPLLETLVFRGCTGIDHFYIDGPKLKTLRISRTRELKSVSISNTPYLTDVCITPRYEIHNPNLATRLTELLGSLPRIVKLTLDGCFLKFLGAGTVPERLPTINEHLKSLTLHNLDLNDLGQIPCALCLLRSSANLQELKIKAFAMENTVMDPVLNFPNELDCMDLKLYNLNTVKFEFYKASRAELLFVEFLLACSPLLERMLVKFDGSFNANDGYRIWKELMGFSRASAKANILCAEPPVGV